MIAASHRDSSLELVKLIFSLSENQSSDVPIELKNYITEVIEQAKLLLSNSDNRTQKNPDAIELALEMRASDELASSVEKITTFESITPTIASKVLNHLS